MCKANLDRIVIVTPFRQLATRRSCTLSASRRGAVAGSEGRPVMENMMNGIVLS